MSNAILQGGVSGSGSITLLAPNTNSTQTLTLPDNTGTVVSTASTGVVTPAMLTQPLTAGTAQASTSGTSIDFTGIPSWVKRITVMFNGVSTNGTSPMQIQIGAGSVTASGYIGSSTGGGGAVATTNNSTGFLVTYINVAATLYSGIAIVSTLGSNAWVESGTLGGSSTGVMNTSGGALTLGGILDRVRITTVNGTDTFDAGSINILWE